MKTTILLIFISLSFISKSQIDTTEFQGTITRYEKMPAFKGGHNELMKFLNTLAIYNENAKIEKAEGRVYVSFFIEPDGSLSEIKLARGIQPDLDSIAVSVVKKMNKKWEPGTQNSKPVKIQFVLPINFSLENLLFEGDKASCYWNLIGKKKFKRICKKKFNLNGNEYNCWYTFIVQNHNNRKLKDLDIKLMFENFKCKNTQ